MSEVDAEYLVFGFIADIESNLSKNIIIPEAIKQLCFEYYFIFEQFVDHGDNIEMNKTNDIAWQIKRKGSDRCCNTIYGQQIVDPSKKEIRRYKWTLQLLAFKGMNGFYFGIDSSDKEFLNGDYTSRMRNKKQFYAFTVSKFVRRTETLQRKCHKLEFNVGDIICLILDVEQKTFGIIINDDMENSTKHNDVRIDNIKYRLAVTLTFSEQKVQLLKYETERY